MFETIQLVTGIATAYIQLLQQTAVTCAGTILHWQRIARFRKWGSR